MRFLVVVAPLLSAVQSVAPLGRALVDAGHDVLVATAGEAASVEIGLPVTDVAPRFSYLSTGVRIAVRHPLITRAERNGTAGTRAAAITFGSVNDQLADSVVALAESHRPDVVVHDPLAVAGALAAAAIAVPAVLHNGLLGDGPELVAATAARLSRALRRHGVAALPPAAATIGVAPPSLVGPRDALPMRFVPHHEDADLPEWLTRPPSRARIAVCLGRAGGPAMNQVIAACATVEADLVMIEPAAPMSKPGPAAAVLRHCAAVVHPADASAVLTALHAGVPQLALNGNSPQRHNAALVAERGVGLAADDYAVTADLIIRLITDAALSSNAAAVRAEMAGMPSPTQLVGHLASLARSKA
ncbi:glycosyltransferase [Paractinoplanes lichenicola]|uniref:DUF1205 domain-containing protein n=1 Tax=Paractinoplanes lichenicola TaxID=2802976 RepID=A0ABS1W638_9ACTN|nr:nucleotide disphospho-sugar-binding domain-containing protein [Actinoplanes lichenicola]MBL7262195.1 DUF1205 domain-containing protein [Actinoplanes lichenicola]